MLKNVENVENVERDQHNQTESIIKIENIKK
jgi:hypothetical protein